LVSNFSPVWLGRPTRQRLKEAEAALNTEGSISSLDGGFFYLIVVDGAFMRYNGKGDIS
jgi:hypothetical protein